jgi:hypothetical protein
MSKADNLHHAEWCPTSRVETSDYPERQITTTHCVDCGAHEAKDRNGKTLQVPAVTGGLSGAGDGAGITVPRDGGETA